jgi:hypothetical protein
VSGKRNDVGKRSGNLKAGLPPEHNQFDSGTGNYRPIIFGDGTRYGMTLYPKTILTNYNK